MERTLSPVFALNAEAKRIEEIYPRYSEDLLNVLLDDYLVETVEYLARTRRTQYRLADSFSHAPLSEDDRLRIKGRKVVCMSLFFKPSNFAKRDRLPATGPDGQIPMKELTRAGHPIFDGSRRSDRSFIENYLRKTIDSDFGEWVPVAFLAEDLRVLEPMLRDRGWIVVNMRHTSVAHNPGAMWRFLGFNLDCAVCYVQDTDRSFNRGWADRMAHALGKHPRTALVRQLQTTGVCGEMALILGNDFMICPANIGFDVRRMMLGYIVLNLLHEDRLTNFVHEPHRGRSDTEVQPLSKRLARPHAGGTPGERVPRKCYPYYGFDEQWLKEFLYYHLGDGRTISFVKNLKPEDHIQRLDLQFQMAGGNTLLSMDGGGASLAKCSK